MQRETIQSWIRHASFNVSSCSWGWRKKPLQIKVKDGEFSDFPLYADSFTYICEIQVDLDHVDLLYVGQEVEFKGHMVYVANQRDKYPPIRKKVRI